MREFSTSDSPISHLQRCISKQNEEDGQSSEAPIENSELQQDDDDSSSSEEDELPQRQTKTTKSEPWDRIMETVFDTLENIFGESSETYLKQNPRMEIADAGKKAVDELKSNYRQALISQHHDLVQMGNILKKKRHNPQANKGYNSNVMI